MEACSPIGRAHAAGSHLRGAARLFGDLRDRPRPLRRASTRSRNLAPASGERAAMDQFDDRGGCLPLRRTGARPLPAVRTEGGVPAGAFRTGHRARQPAARLLVRARAGHRAARGCGRDGIRGASHGDLARRPGRGADGDRGLEPAAITGWGGAQFWRADVQPGRGRPAAHSCPLHRQRHASDRLAESDGGFGGVQRLHARLRDWTGHHGTAGLHGGGGVLRGADLLLQSRIRPRPPGRW